MECIFDSNLFDQHETLFISGRENKCFTISVGNFGSFLNKKTDSDLQFLWATKYRKSSNYLECSGSSWKIPQEIDERNQNQTSGTIAPYVGISRKEKVDESPYTSP